MPDPTNRPRFSDDEPSPSSTVVVSEMHTLLPRLQSSQFTAAFFEATALLVLKVTVFWSQFCRLKKFILELSSANISTTLLLSFSFSPSLVIVSIIVALLLGYAKTSRFSAFVLPKIFFISIGFFNATFFGIITTVAFFHFAE